MCCLSNTLREKHNEMKTIIDDHMTKMRKELRDANAKETEFYKDAELKAPKEDWEERLNEDDIPKDLAGVNKALNASKTIVSSIEYTRRSVERKNDIDAMKMGLEELFKRETVDDEPQPAAPGDSSDDVVATNKRKRSESDVGGEDGGDSGETPKGSNRKKSASTAKKVQADISAFFGKGSSGKK